MNGMDQVVVDASVFAKLFIKEEYSENAYALRDAYIAKKVDIIVPSLFPYEVLNALKYSASYDEKELENLAEILDDYKLGIFNFNSNLGKRISSVATKYNITIYDASYVALAEMMNTLLYTADEKLIKKVGLSLIRHIKDFEQ